MLVKDRKRVRRGFLLSGFLVWSVAIVTMKFSTLFLDVSPSVSRFLRISVFHSSVSSVESVGGATRFIGRKVVWPVRKHEAQGKIVSLHGKNGFVRVRFRKGVPGQTLGSLVEVID